MHELFSGSSAINKGRLLDPAFISIARAVKINQPIISNRIVSMANFVGPDNLILKILTGLAIPHDIEDWQIDRYIRRRTASLSLSLRTTSVNSYGTTFTGQITPHGIESIVLTNESYTDELWSDLSPITFLYHNNTNVNYDIGSENKDAVSLIKINVTMLVKQYREWAKWNVDVGIVESPLTFIAKYAIKNSILSYMDISLFNLHYFKVAGFDIPKDPKINGISTPNISGQLEKSRDKILGELMQKNPTMGYCLNSTPSFFKVSAIELTVRPDVIYTQQINWLLTVSMLPFAHYGILIGDSATSSANQTNYSTLTRELRSFLGSRVIDKQPTHLKNWALSIINDILERIS